MYNLRERTKKRSLAVVGQQTMFLGVCHWENAMNEAGQARGK